MQNAKMQKEEADSLKLEMETEPLQKMDEAGWISGAAGCRFEELPKEKGYESCSRAETSNGRRHSHQNQIPDSKYCQD